jgi:hypothetical protein
MGLSYINYFHLLNPPVHLDQTTVTALQNTFTDVWYHCERETTIYEFIMLLTGDYGNKLNELIRQFGRY